MQPSTSNIPALSEYFSGHLRHGGAIYTVHCGNRKFMDQMPTKTQAPSPTHTSMDGDYRHTTWTSPKMPYLIFLPRSNPFHGSLFERLNVTTQPGPKASPLVSSDAGWSLDPAIVAKWTSLENPLRSILQAMYAELGGSLFEGMLSVPFPSQFGYRNAPWHTRDLAAVALRHSRDAFLPFIATITMLFVLLNGRDRDGSWRSRVINASNVHPQWFADLESSAAGNMNVERVGGIIDLTLTWKAPMDVLLTACIGKFPIPLYLHWGAIKGSPRLPIPSVLRQRKFFPDDAEVKYLHNSSGNVSFSAWDCRGEVYVSQRDANLHAPQSNIITPSVTPASAIAPVELTSESSTSPLDNPAVNTGRTPPPVGSHSSQKAGEAVRAFLGRRKEKYEKWLATETSVKRTARLAREAHAAKGAPPGKKGARVFIWDEEDDFLVRKPLNRTFAADMWDEFTDNQRHYDSWADEWDLCKALAPEQEAGDDDDGEGYEDTVRREPEFPTLPAIPAPILLEESSLPDIPVSLEESLLPDAPVSVREEPTLPDVPARILPDEPSLPDVPAPIFREEPEPESHTLPDAPAPLLPEEPIGPHSTGDDLTAVYTSWIAPEPEGVGDLYEPYEPFLAMDNVPYSRFGFTVPEAPAQKYREGLRDDFSARAVGDERWIGLEHPTFALLPVLLAHLSDAESLGDIPQELLDLRQDVSDISAQVWAVDVHREILNGQPQYVLQPCSPGYDSDLYILLSSAVTTLEIVRMGWGLSSIQEIVFHLFQRGIEFRLCRRGPLRPQPRPPLFQTGLGWRPAGYRPTLTDYLAYEERRDEFLRSPRGRAARFAGGIVGRLAVDLAMVLTDDEIAARGPSDESFEHSVCLWDGQSSTAYWDDALTPDEINLICGVYVVNTGQRSSAEDDGWQKKAISWWPTPTSFFFSGLNIGWWSPDCERWYQKRLLDFKNHSAQLFTQAEWKHNMRFIQKSRIVAKANERLAAEYLHRKLAE